jgi:phage-related protein
MGATHGIYFDGVHSYYDLNLFLSKVEISPATPKTNYVDIPGSDGSIDFTEIHGEVKYKIRDIKYTFTVNPLDDMTWEEKQKQVAIALNGRKFERITPDRDEDYYWTGRCTISKVSDNKGIRQIVVSAKVNPYKLQATETVRSFDLTAAAQTVILTNGRKSVVPVITCTGAASVVFKGNTYQMDDAGTYKILDICLTEGTNVLQISGTGTMKFTYREGDL